MSKIVLIGDVHGKIAEYQRLLRRFMEPTIQVGDMGIGFTKGGIPITVGDLDKKDRWFHGNHDNPVDCSKEKGYLGRFGMTSEGIFFASGAFSVDAFYRTIDRDWFYDEELTEEEMSAALQLYTEMKPDIVATHECPKSIRPFMLHAINKPRGPIYESRTTDFLERCLLVHKPKIWVFGHWHRSFDREIDGVRFICLNELEPVTLEF